MSIEREARELVARCVSIMVCHLYSERTPEADDGMRADVRAVAACAAGLGDGPFDVEGLILRPVEDELLARFGHEAGVRLNGVFRDAFEGRAAPDWSRRR